jgi:hypothetical protein
MIKETVYQNKTFSLEILTRKKAINLKISHDVELNLMIAKESLDLKILLIKEISTLTCLHI